MTYVKIFTDVKPPARSDGVPFTQAIIQEAVAASGTWATIETIMLSPVDTDAAFPIERTLTTNHAAIDPNGWYRIIWQDMTSAQFIGDVFQMFTIGGAIADRTRSILPITWDALAEDSRYGAELLQRRVDVAKEWVFGSVITVAEEDAYQLRVLDFVAKLAAIEIIPAGIDFWMNQSLTVVVRGPDETDTFTDRAKALADLRKDLLLETKAKADEILPLLPTPHLSLKSVPKVSSMDDELITPSPQEFPRPYVVTNRS